MIGNDGRVRATQGKTQYLVSDFSITIAVSPIVMICTEAYNWPGLIWWLIGYGVNDLLSWVYYIGEPAVITTSTRVLGCVKCPPRLHSIFPSRNQDRVCNCAGIGREVTELVSTTTSVA